MSPKIQPITNLPNKLTIYLLDKNISEARQAGFDNEYTFVSHKDYTLSSNGNSAKISKSTITANTKKASQSSLSQMETKNKR